MNRPVCEYAFKQWASSMQIWCICTCTYMGTLCGCCHGWSIRGCVPWPWPWPCILVCHWLEHQVMCAFASGCQEWCFSSCEWRLPPRLHACQWTWTCPYLKAETTLQCKIRPSLKPDAWSLNVTVHCCKPSQNWNWNLLMKIMQGQLRIPAQKLARNTQDIVPGPTDDLHGNFA